MPWFLMLAGIIMVFGRFWDAVRRGEWPINSRERISAVVALPLVLYGALPWCRVVELYLCRTRP